MVCGWVQKSIDNHVESGEIKIKNVFVMFMIFTSEAACKDEVINFSNTGTRAGVSRKSDSKVVRGKICLFFYA